MLLARIYIDTVQLDTSDIHSVVGKDALADGLEYLVFVELLQNHAPSNRYLATV